MGNQLEEGIARHEIAASELVAWDVYFAGLVAFQLHPGNHQDPDGIDLGPWERLADRMIMARRRRY